MNIRYILLLLALSLAAGCAAPVHRYDPWFGQDKLLHFAGSSLIGAGVTAAALDDGAGRDAAPALGVTVSLGVGFGKEAADATVRESFWSWRDIAWDAAGAITGAWLVRNAR